MRIKSEHLDTFISCPATGKIINTLFLDKELYQYYYNNGYEYLFILNSDNKAEIEIKPELYNEMTSKSKKN